MIHQRTHPRLDVEGCFGCRIASVSVSADAMPTRHPRAAEINATERRWSVDMDAYKRVVASGTQPNNIDGCAHLEKHAQHKYDWAMMKETGWAPKDVDRAERFMDDIAMPHI